MIKRMICWLRHKESWYWQEFKDGTLYHWKCSKCGEKWE